MQRMLSSGAAGPSGLDHRGLVPAGTHSAQQQAQQLHAWQLGALSQTQQALGPGLPQGAYVGAAPVEVEPVLKEAHETYRKGEFMQALQLCHAVRRPHHRQLPPVCFGPCASQGNPLAHTGASAVCMTGAEAAPGSSMLSSVHSSDHGPRMGGCVVAGSLHVLGSSHSRPLPTRCVLVAAELSRYVWRARRSTRRTRTARTCCC